MINFIFSFDEPTDNLSGFDLGHIDITYGEKIISSRNKTPDQSMMLFTTVTELLFGYKRFFLDKSLKEYACIGTDSSFSILFIRSKKDEVSIKVNEELICKIDKVLLAKIIFNSCNRFINDYINKIPEDDPVVEDIMMAINRFKEII